MTRFRLPPPPTNGKEWSLRARWVFPAEQLPIENGTITLAGDRIVAVGLSGPNTTDVDLGDVAILPGLVNAHTHLDLSGLRGQAAPGTDFTAWLRGVIAHRRQQTPEQAQQAIRDGLAECVRFGTTLVGDVSAAGQSWPALASGPIRAVVFYELLGLPKDRADEALHTAQGWLASHSATGSCRPGLSPHAPYSTRLDLIERAAVLAGEKNLPLAIHLAETLDECSLLHRRAGRFVDFLHELGVWSPEGLATSPRQVVQACQSAAARLFVHGNYLAPSDPIPPGGSIIYCPRTHAAFGHAPHPFRSFLQRGVNVALGTDSLASNPDLDMLAEARFIHHRFPHVPGEALLRMITINGARALGLESITGSLAAGKSADLIVLPLTGESDDLYEPVFATDTPVAAVMCRGQWQA